MSRDFGFKFHLRSAIGVRSILNHLVQAGWNPDDYGSVSYLVDPDFFDWQSTELENVESVYESLSATQESRLPCAIVLTWKDTQIGGSFIFMPSKEEVTLSPVINPVRRADCEMLLDFEWYLSRLVAVLESVGMSGLETFDYAD
ncbi:hypothetical protein [Streptomyces sp. col6]|uniref:hypothetical protein n=1 Tax=Streptomyces sp. col6 TaxID=2478958 RepID=UPI0011CE372D|nr:hypothetical protein [Streptomyces sp. col6]